MANVFEFRSSTFIPARLREAREAMELSMTDLGEKVGVSRQAISFYEDGQRTPEPEILLRLVEVLEQPIFYFTTDRPASFGADGVRFFRAFKSKTKRLNAKCEVLSDWFAQTASYFSEFVNLPNVALPEIAPPRRGNRYSDSEIEEAATQCRRFWGLGDGPIADVIALLESKGVIIARSEFGDETVSAFSFWQGARPFIFLGADRDSSCRSRYDASHEFGHLVLHRGIDENDLETDLDRIEAEADRFAGAFLLPEQTYPIEVFSSRLAAFLHLKRRWKVSAAAQIYRCSELGVLTEQQVLNLRKQLSANRWRKREPLDDAIELELPTVMAKSLKLLLESRRKTVADVLSGVRLAKPTVEALVGVTLSTQSDAPQSPMISLRRD